MKICNSKNPPERSLAVWLAGGFFWLVLLAAIGCGDRRDQSRNYLIYWSSNNQDEIDFATRVVAEWNRLHPETPVHHQPIPEGQSSEEVILAAVVGKTTPDIYSNMWPGDVESYARAGVLVPLDEFADFDSVAQSRFDPDKLQEARSLDGRIYQFPWKTNPIMMMYNSGIFAEADIERPPRTYSEYLDAAARITADTDGDGYLDRWMGMRDIRAIWWQRLFDFYTFYIAASSGQTLLKGREVVFDNPAAVGVFRFLSDLFAKGYFPREKALGRGDLFLKGQVATRFTGPWAIAQVEKFKPPGFEYDFSAIPVPDDHQGPVYTYGDYKNIVIFRTAPNPKAAWDFVKFMTSRKNDYLLLSITNQLPLRQGLQSDPVFHNYFEENPKMLPFALQARYVRGIDAAPMMKEVFDAIAQEFEACVVFSVKSPEQAVADAAARVALILE
jgi:multiple sugar transport system substrate-binding protein